MDSHTHGILQNALTALADFKRAFGRDLTPSLLGEIYAATELDLVPTGRCNEPGFDLVDGHGRRYQVKQREPNTLNIDVNNFGFDYLALVNLAPDYTLLGM